MGQASGSQRYSLRGREPALGKGRLVEDIALEDYETLPFTRFAVGNAS